MTKSLLSGFFIIFIFSWVPYSVAENLFRHYREKNVQQKSVQTKKPLYDQKRQWLWEKPDHWTKDLSSKDKMSFLRFKVSSDALQGDEEGLCTLTFLPLIAGDLRPNIERWMRQLNLSLSAEVIDNWIEKTPQKKTSSGLPFRSFDFGEFVKKADSSNILVVVLPLPKNIAFVKLTGSKALIESQKTFFFGFIDSLKERNG
ncbi:hypothetical protein AB834_01375 [PVC group bacterium (ex Bugula neritina AB1)]|nr:hypothetical protein AB834_01375 [PVC group bacterium (ex Bugula neritina AB1)]